MISNKFRPSTLVPREGASETEKGDFLTDELFLEGIIMRTCSDNDIYHSNAFMVKTGSGEKAAPDKYRKIQDKVFFKAYAKICCREELCKRRECIKSDSHAAEIVVEKLDRLKNGERMENEYVENVRMVRPFSQDNAPDHVREGIRYICKQTGYTEIAFPVRLYDRVMGAFIVGQIIAKDNKDNWCEIIEQKCRNAHYRDEDIAVIKGYSDEAESEEEIEKTIQKVSKAVDDIEKELKAVYRERQKQYGLEQGNIYVDRFKKNYKIAKKEVEDTTKVFPAATCIEIYGRLGQCIRDCISGFCGAVGVERYALFLPDEKNLTENDYKQLRCDELRVEIQKLTEDNPDKTSMCGQEVVGRYVSNADAPYDYIIIFESEGYPIALLLCIDEFLQEVDSGEEKKLLRESLSNIFRYIFSYVQMFGIQERSEYFRTYLDSSMSIMRHELGQSNAGYLMCLERFRRNMSRYTGRIFGNQNDYTVEVNYSFLDDCVNFIRDSERYLYTTKVRIDSTKYLTEFEPKAKQFFYPYEEFLFKWQQIYYKTAEDNNLGFEIPRIAKYDPLRPRMYGDPTMVEQAVYNLTNNAVKYAMRGTKISLDCRLNSDKTRYEITVKNIGHPLSEDEKETIFEYGRRGSNNKKDGSGLGLFLTRQIALAHGGDVECDIKWLSEYNWSLVRPYMSLYEDRNVRYFCKDRELYGELEKEWREKQQEIEKCIVREVPHNAFSAMYVQQNIRNGTAEFTFTFWLPHEE